MQDDVREVMQTEQANLTQLAEDVKVAKTETKIRGIFSIVEGIMSVLSGGLTVGAIGTAVKDILSGYTMLHECKPCLQYEREMQTVETMMKDVESLEQMINATNILNSQIDNLNMTLPEILPVIQEDKLNLNELRNYTQAWKAR